MILRQFDTDLAGNEFEPCVDLAASRDIPPFDALFGVTQIIRGQHSARSNSEGLSLSTG